MARRAVTLLARLDAHGTDDPDFREGHPEDRCPLCEWPVCDHVVQPHACIPRLRTGRAKWPHRRAALLDLIGQWIDRKVARP